MKIPGLAQNWRIRTRGALCSAALALLWAHTPAASAVEVSGNSKGGGSFQEYPVNGVPMLDSFFFQFTDGDDHNVQAIAVEPASPVPNPCFDCSDVTPGKIFVTLQDEDRDDPYFFKVSHIDVPVGIRQRVSDYCEESCRIPLKRPSRDSVFVLVGFSFFFPGEDHQIQRIGVWEENGELVVHYEDETGDDLFRIDVEFVYLPPAMVPRRGNVSGVAASGSDVATVDLGLVASGPTVIRGFDFVFRPELDVGLNYDEEIKTFGIRTPGNKIEVFCADNENDLFDWGVDWGALKISVLDPPLGR